MLRADSGRNRRRRLAAIGDRDEPSVRVIAEGLRWLVIRIERFLKIAGLRIVGIGDRIPYRIGHRLQLIEGREIRVMEVLPGDWAGDVGDPALAIASKRQ